MNDRDMNKTSVSFFFISINFCTAYSFYNITEYSSNIETEELIGHHSRTLAFLLSKFNVKQSTIIIYIDGLFFRKQLSF
jgi:hypothetical protein